MGYRELWLFALFYKRKSGKKLRGNLKKRTPAEVGAGRKEEKTRAAGAKILLAVSDIQPEFDQYQSYNIYQ